MRRSNFCCCGLKKSFKRQANRRIRSESRILCRKMLAGKNPDAVSFTPAYRAGCIDQWG